MLRETILSLPGRFQPKMAGNLQTTIQFNFTGTSEQFFVLSIAGGRCTVAEGLIDNPAATVSMSAADFIGLNKGEILAPELFWGGQIEIEGDVDAVIGLAPVMGW